LFTVARARDDGRGKAGASAGRQSTILPCLLAQQSTSRRSHHASSGTVNNIKIIISLLLRCWQLKSLYYRLLVRRVVDYCFNVRKEGERSTERVVTMPPNKIHTISDFGAGGQQHQRSAVSDSPTVRPAASAAFNTTGRSTANSGSGGRPLSFKVCHIPTTLSNSEQAASLLDRVVR